MISILFVREKIVSSNSLLKVIDLEEAGGKKSESIIGGGEDTVSF